jgi:hypothetical protein
MKRIETSIVVGLVLIGAGLLFLLQNLGVLGPVQGLIWALLFAVGGGAFLMAFARVPARWWALIPGSALLSLGVLIGSQEVAPALAGPWGGTLFLGGIGLGFGAIYLAGRERWWALIPGGTLLTLAAVAGLSENFKGADLGWVFFLGLALTFGLIAIVPAPQGRMRWALFPAGVLLLLALAGFSGGALEVTWPVVMILGGVYLAYRALRAPQRRQIVASDPALAESVPLESHAAPLQLSHEALQPLERVVGEATALETARKEAL